MSFLPETTDGHRRRGSFRGPACYHPWELERRWGKRVPDWVCALAEECRRTSIRATAKRLGVIDPTVINVLKARKPNSPLQATVRAVLMTEGHTDG